MLLCGCCALAQVLTYDDLVPALQHPEALISSTAVSCLPHLDDPAPAVPLLVDKLTSNAAPEAAVALRLLIRLKPEVVMPALQQLLIPSSTASAAALGGSTPAGAQAAPGTAPAAAARQASAKEDRKSVV